MFSNQIGEVSPSQITPKDIDRFVNEQVELGLKPTTIRLPKLPGWMHQNIYRSAPLEHVGKVIPVPKR